MPLIAGQDGWGYKNGDTKRTDEKIGRIKAETLQRYPWIHHNRLWSMPGYSWISKAEALIMFEADIYHASNEYLKLPWEKVKNLNQNRRRVIVEMIFNLGLGGVLGFKRMWGAIMAGDFKRAADEMIDSEWARQVGARAGLLADEMENG